MLINEYYKSLPRGNKDEFIREVSEAIGQSSSNVRTKLRNGRWSILEVREINRLIEKRGG